MAGVCSVADGVKHMVGAGLVAWLGVMLRTQPDVHRPEAGTYTFQRI